MSEPKQRIVVDSVEFGQLFQFPRVLRSVTQAMQPPRLMVGLLIVVALMGGGWLWDKWFDTPNINPAGLLASPHLYDEALAQDYLWEVLPESSRLRDEADPMRPRLDPRVVRREVEQSRRFERNREVEGGVAKEQIEARDREVTAIIARIERERPKGAFEATAQHAAAGFVRIVKGVFSLRPDEVFEGFADILVRMPVALFAQKRAFTIWYGLLLVVVVSIGGGALSRMAACEFAGRERLRVRDAMDFAFVGWLRLVAAPLFPLLLAGILTLGLILLGMVLFTFGWVDVLGGALYGLNVLLGFLIAFLLIGLAGSFLMLIPSVACENCGPADALQRAMAYLLARPLHLLGYASVGLAGLALGYIVVSLVGATTLNVASGATSGPFPFPNNTALTMGGGYGIFELMPVRVDFHRNTHNEIAASLVNVWQTIVIFLVVGYVFSYAFTCSTIIYLLMRKTVDGQDVAEIWRPGLIPGTLAPIPRRARTTGSGERPRDEEESPRTTDSLLAGGLRRLASLRVRKAGAPDAAAGSSSPDVEAEQGSDDPAQAEDDDARTPGATERRNED